MPTSLYTIVSCNRYGIRNKLINHPEHESAMDSLNISDHTTVNESFASEHSKNMEPVIFTIMIPTQEFEELIIFKSYKRMQRNKIRNRIWKTLRPGIREEFITHKIWDATHLKCGFKFRNHYLSNDVGISGYINGGYKSAIIQYLK